MKIFLALLLILISKIEAEDSHSQQIQDFILSTYGNLNLPGDSIVVRFNLNLFGVTQVDTIQGVISISCYFNLRWNDPKIRWDPEDFGGISYITIRVDFGLIWIPDIFMYENAEQPFDQLAEDQIMLRVNYDGEIYWSRPGVIMIKHQFDLRGYPFDIQHIHMTFSSWLCDITKIQLKSNEEQKHSTLTGHYFSNNVEWKFLSLDWKDVREEWLNLIFFIIFRSAGSFDMVYIDIKIQRNGGIVMSFLIVPSLFCGLILLFFYFVPIDSNDRINFIVNIFQNIISQQLTMLLSIVLLILVMFDKLPLNNQDMLAKEMFDVIVYSSFVLFFWVAIIGTVYKSNADNYERVKRQLSAYKEPKQEITSKLSFYKIAIEKLDKIIEKLDEKQQVQQEQNEKQVKMLKTEQLQIQNKSAASLMDKDSVENIYIPSNFKALLYLLGLTKIKTLPLKSQKIAYSKILKLIKSIDMITVIIAFLVFFIINLRVIIIFSRDYW